MSITITTLKMKAGYNTLAKLIEMMSETGTKPVFGSSTLKALGLEENKSMPDGTTIFSELEAFEKLPKHPDFSAKFISLNPFSVLKNPADFSLNDIKNIAEKINEVNEKIAELYTLVGAEKVTKTEKRVERIIPEALDGVPMVEIPEPEPEPAETKPEAKPEAKPAGKNGKK